MNNRLIRRRQSASSTANPAPITTISPLIYNGPNNPDEALAHMQFLQTLLQQEDDRLNLIESKTSQFIGQTGLTFSLLSLFVPLLVDKLDGIHISIKIGLLLLLLMSFGFYLLTINSALRNYNVKNFPYSTSNPINVINFQHRPREEFYAEITRDLMDGIKVNTELNDTKADNLIVAFKNFRIANFLTGALVFVFCSTLLFVHPKNPSVKISDPVKVEHFDTLIKKLTPPKLKSDTVKIMVRRHRHDGHLPPNRHTH